MRNDIYERIKLLKKDNIKPNFAAIAQKYDCDYRTVKKYYENPDTQPFKKTKLSKLDDFKSIIDEKLEIPCTAFSLSKWGDIFNDNVIATAIIDRLVHHSSVIKITGKSYRIKDHLSEDSGENSKDDD